MASKRNEFYTENPYYTLFIRPTRADDDPPDGEEPPPSPRPEPPDEEDEGTGDCYQDPATGEFVCHVTKSPQPQPPWPKDDPEPEPGPEEEPWKKIALLLAELMTQPQNEFLRQPRQYGMIEPLNLSLEPLPIRALPSARPAASQTIQARTHQQALNKINEARQQHLEQRLQRNPRDTSHLVREMLDVNLPNRSTSEIMAQSVPFEYQSVMNPTDQRAFQNLVNPPTGATQPLIQENQGWIQGNLAYGAKPVRTADYLRDMQSQEFARRQADAQAEQIALAQAQQRALQFQQWATERPQDTKLTTDEKEKQQKKQESPYLAPEDAYKLIQSGKYSEVKNQKISKYYTWGDAFKGTAGYPVALSNIKSIPIQTYINAQKMAIALDAVSRNLGQKALINNWIRPGDTKYHGRGLAVDFEGNKAFKDGALYTALRRTAEIKRIGQPDNDYSGMHADIGSTGAKPGTHFLFIDNGHYKSGRNYNVPILKGPQSARLKPGT